MPSDPEKASPDAEEEDDGKKESKDAPGKSAGMSQASKDDWGVCIVIALIVGLAVVVTVVKIVLLDIHTYPHLFGLEGDEEGAEATTQAAGR